jgi:hypothetical protein|tara:strand:+ start:16062 stop:16547 length:486 start_codon:yes stop_codon:yes gene_type:complete
MSEFNKALRKYSNYVISQSRRNLTMKGNNASGKLYKSLGYKITGTKINFYSEKYGPFIDQGVRGSEGHYADQATAESPFSYKNKMPPPSAFDKWTIKKGIAPRDKEGRFIKRQSLNFLIARKIFKIGIRASLYFTKPFERGLDLYGDEMVAAYATDKLEKI